MTNGELWSKIALGAAGIAGALASLVWGDAKRRISTMEKELIFKADREDTDDKMEKLRENVKNLFEKEGELRESLRLEFKETALAISALDKTLSRVEARFDFLEKSIEALVERRSRPRT